jgi:hypothetical protein
MYSSNLLIRESSKQQLNLLDMWRRFHVTNSMGTTMMITNLIMNVTKKNIVFGNKQDLRILPHKRGEAKIGSHNIAYCRTCNTKFDSEKLAWKLSRNMVLDRITMTVIFRPC